MDGVVLRKHKMLVFVDGGCMHATSMRPLLGPVSWIGDWTIGEDRKSAGLRERAALGICILR
jgi:hypothetical protein